MTRQRGQHHGDLRPALVAAALEILGEADPHALTLRAVARRVGVTPAAPYHHFQDRAALLAAVALDGFRKLGEVQDGVRARTPEQRVQELTTAYIRFAVRHHAHYTVMMESLQAAARPPRPEGDGGELDRAARLTFATLADAVQDARPDLSQAEARRRALQVWAQAVGAVAVLDVAGGLDPRFDGDAVVAGAAAAAHALVSA